MANLLKMLGRLIGEHITLQFDRNDKLPIVEADPGMVEQVLMNLAVNARDAMPKGGRLTIGINPIQADAERVKGHSDAQPGLFACLSVTDAGCGMDETTLKRLFEPFFTTKEPGKGTGLGLATVYGIVAQHKGWVEVQSEIGKGTTFNVFFPATTKVMEEPGPTKETAALGGHETILLVEDEASVRRVLRQVLRKLGYRVLEAEMAMEPGTCGESTADISPVAFRDGYAKRSDGFGLGRNPAQAAAGLEGHHLQRLQRRNGWTKQGHRRGNRWMNRSRIRSPPCPG